MSNIHSEDFKVREHPRVTFSSLAEILSSPAHRLPSILTKQKFPTPGPVFGYKKATEKLIAWCVDGVPPNSSELTREYEAAVIDLITENYATPNDLIGIDSCSFSKPPQVDSWSIDGVEVSVFPDLMVEAEIKGKIKKGAVKFYMSKTPTEVGSSLAALIYYHQKEVLGNSDVDPSLCAVVDVRNDELYVATGSYRRLVKQATDSCKVIASLWGSLEKS